MNSVVLSAGVRLPALGLGTWHMGEAARTRAAEVAAVRLAIEIGYRVVDTAEMYGEGGAEEVVGQAVAEALRSGAVTRDELFIVSKVYPHNASRAGVVAACDRSLRRLALDSIDLYLLHWPGPHPLRDTVTGFEALRVDGRIRHWGVSNFDTAEMKALADAGGARCAANQVYYSLSTRGAEFDLLPWQRERSMPLMAYCPLDQGGLVDEPVLREVAGRHGASASQVALAWLMAQQGVMVIPKAVREAHLRENFAAADLVLDAADLSTIERRFPAPRRKQALAMR
ncbi:MAG TPA: aldo/keto reductase [Burkholderiaceae bacterium]|nr:aldo/keto reductase [Burkholderiaceae bacterium]